MTIRSFVDQRHYKVIYQCQNYHIHRHHRQIEADPISNEYEKGKKIY